MIRKVTATSSGLTIATTAYTSGDQLGAQLTFSVDSLSLGGVIKGVTLIDKGDVVTDVDLVLFDATTTPAADNAAAAWSDADMAKSIGFVRLTDDVDFGGARIVMPAITTGVAIPFYAPAGVLYGALVTRSANAVFTAATDLVVHLLVDV